MLDGKMNPHIYIDTFIVKEKVLGTITNNHPLDKSTVNTVLSEDRYHE